MREPGQNLELISKYLQGETSPEEKKELFRWVETAPANRKTFEQYSRIWQLSQQETGYEPDLEAGWQRFQQSIRGNKEAKTRKPGTAPYWIKAAASFFLAVIFFWGIYQYLDQPDIVSYATAENEQQQVELPDGSQVWLNENSRVWFETGSGSFNRSLNLEGEAFFEIEQAQGKRFTVVTPLSRIEVLGTSFNVVARPEQETRVQVVTGRVAMTPLEKENYIYLEPGEIGVLQMETSEPESETFENENFQAWRTGELSFRSVNLETVLQNLETYFGVEVDVANPSLLKCRFTGNFSRPELEEVIEVLQVSLELEVQRQGQTIILSGQGCN
jgi:ferric-dicitrate binding protein FerR (iron transport regulator)